MTGSDHEPGHRSSVSGDYCSFSVGVSVEQGLCLTESALLGHRLTAACVHVILGDLLMTC